MLIGATVAKEEIPYWEDKLDGLNKWMRVFPNGDGLIPSKTDLRYAYLKRIGCATVFVSSKLHMKFVGGSHGSFTEGLDLCRQRIIDLVNEGFTVYYVENHEPEKEQTPEVYKNNFNVTYAMKATLPDNIREKVFIGHALTKQWTEVANKGNFNYSKYDTGTGDFFGVDFYGNSWDASYDPIESFVKHFKAYRFNSSDVRPRCFPELGYIGLPYDTDGSLRAAWLEDLHTELKTWVPNTTGWPFLGWIWWNTSGTAGTSIPGIGTKRFFHLDRKHSGEDQFTVLNPPHPLNTWREIATEELATGALNGEEYARGFEDGRKSRDAELTQKFNDGVARGRLEGVAALQTSLIDAYISALNSTTPRFE